VGKSQKTARRELIEKMQRDQARADKRRTILIVATAVVVGLGIIAFPAVQLIQQSIEKNRTIADIGAAASAASCDAPTETAASGTQQHVAEGTKVTYSTSPPTSGQHYPVWAQFGKTFYDKSDRPAIGNLVHNLEHGYTILWYNDTAAADKKQTDVIEQIAKGKLPAETNGKFIAAPYHADDGKAWPAGKNIAFTHWDGGGGDEAKQKGHLQYCGSVSGEALADFMKKYPALDSPEPNGM
jgi:cytoskeletal protein RodZ